jgi:acyl-CoA thioesterase-1
MNKTITSIMLFSILTTVSVAQNKTIKYISIGDSYTIGEGIDHNLAWPFVLTKRLNEAGLNVKLIANPSVTGFTTQGVLDNEMDIFEKTKPDFATLMIGVNDYVRVTDIKVFHKRLNTIIDKMQKTMTDKTKLILVTIPDYSVTPQGGQYAKGRDVSRDLIEWNKVIIEEGKKRGLPVVDVMKVTQEMKGHPELIANDGLHPSEKEHAIWESMIYKEAVKLFK